jgi:hypothetical protein
VQWFRAQVATGVWSTLRGTPRLSTSLLSLEQEVAAGRVAPDRAARQVLSLLLDTHTGESPVIATGAASK